MGLFNKKELVRIADLEEELQRLKKEQQELGITDCIQAKEKNKQLQKDYEAEFKASEQKHREEIEKLKQSISSLNIDFSQNEKNYQI